VFRAVWPQTQSRVYVQVIACTQRKLTRFYPFEKTIPKFFSFFAFPEKVYQICYFPMTESALVIISKSNFFLKKELVGNWRCNNLKLKVISLVLFVHLKDV